VLGKAQACALLEWLLLLCVSGFVSGLHAVPELKVEPSSTIVDAQNLGHVPFRTNIAVLNGNVHYKQQDAINDSVSNFWTRASWFESWISGSIELDRVSIRRFFFRLQDIFFPLQRAVGLIYGQIAQLWERLGGYGADGGIWGRRLCYSQSRTDFSDKCATLTAILESKFDFNIRARSWSHYQIVEGFIHDQKLWPIGVYS
jgi:hypothetical protein